MSVVSRHPISFDIPAIYQICVLGEIDPFWSEQLEGMTFSRDDGQSGTKMTTLTGELIDQAALFGVLAALYEWHLTLFSVTRIVKGAEVADVVITPEEDAPAEAGDAEDKPAAA